MTVIRDRVRDEAIAIAKAYSHPDVGVRHVLWGLVHVLGPAAPTEVPIQTVKTYLEPPGTSYATPVMTAEAEAELALVNSPESAKARVLDIAARLAAAPPPADPAADAGAGTLTPTATASTASATATETAGTTPAPATPAPTTKETTDAILAELDALIGLAAVKTAVRKLLAVHLLNIERREAGLPEVGASLHIVFTGNPGTGKTTVARLVARLYGSIGLVSKGHLVEVSRADLVAGYVGQTALKVQAVVDRAVGGALFIDEAYSLAAEGAGEFGAEAIAELVKLMEDHRDDLAVIAAGYPDEMRRFIESNPGLRSRFTHYIDFPDYSASELVAIFEAFAVTAKVELGPDVRDGSRTCSWATIRSATSGTPDCAVAVREMPTRTWRRRAMADNKIEPVEVDDLQVADLPPEDPFTTAQHKIGFRPR